jgi:preprotein translocase subunit YajC
MKRYFDSSLVVLSLILVAQSAFAQGTPGAKQPSLVESLLPMVVMLVVFYFILIRPQAKRQKEKAQFIQNLKRGDEVITSGGIFGRVEGLTETIVNLEIADGVRIKVLKSDINFNQQQMNSAQEGKK